MNEKMNKKLCERFKQLMVDALYNELQEKDRDFFNLHRDSCQSCADEYNGMSETLLFMEKRHQPEMSEAFWDNFLPDIKAKINERDFTEKQKIDHSGLKRFKKWWRNLAPDYNIRWVLYPATAMVLIVSGIAIGFFLDSPEGRRLTGNPELAVQSVNYGINEHFDNLRPVLIDYSNYSAPSPVQGDVIPASDSPADSDTMISVDREALKRLLVQNHLLKKTVARNGNQSLTQLLEDIELILLQISNARSDSERHEAIQWVQEIMKENDVLFKMNVFEKKQAPSSMPSI